MKLKPIGDRVIVKPLEEEEVTKAGIVLPDTADKEKKSEGEIVAVGDGERVKELGLKVGSHVIYGKYGGEDFTEDDIEYKILSVAKEEDKSDVFAIVED